MKGFVHIIESPSADDLLDGRTEGRVLWEALRLAGIGVWYNLATNRQTFLKALKENLAKALTHHRQLPILHFSMHGNDKGVGLTDETFLSWSDLGDILKPLINATQGDLLVCMSSCLSTMGCQMAMHEKEDQPFWALVANSASPSWADAAIAYVTFYHLYFKDIPVPECVDRMKLASDDNNFMFFLGQQVKEDWVAYKTKKQQEKLTSLLRVLDEMIPQPGTPDNDR